MDFEIDRVQSLLNTVKSICKKSGRNFEDISVLAATKYASPEQMNRVIAAGIKIIGENRIQDAQKKISFLLPVKKHFIGTLQSNKVKVAVKIFDVIESLDRIELAQKINEECRKIGKIFPVYVQINVASDPKKHGISSQDVFAFLKQLKFYSFLNPCGIMAIIPFYENREEARPYFRKMKVLFDLCRKDFPQIRHLSMGMSHDFEVALEEGATEIRIGSYFFR